MMVQVKRKMKTGTMALLIAGLSWVPAGCGPKGNQPNIEIIQDMMEQPALKAQDFHPQDREKSSMLVPPIGSWPKNRPPYLYWNQPETAGQKLQNPMAQDAEITQTGRTHYNNFCMVCHGEAGKGDGPVADKWKPIVIPSLMTDKIRNYPDGRIFHIITAGQGLMGSYISMVPEEKDRWAIVNYIRQMQSQTGRGQ
jgi:mono/diheme cytochrome c family protein